MVESPYSAPDQEEQELNVYYALHCMHHSLAQGEAPMLTHLLYTRQTHGGGHVADSENPHVTRAFGLDAAKSWRLVATKTVLYVDRGVSTGMQRARAEALVAGQPVEERRVPHWAELENEWRARRV